MDMPLHLGWPEMALRLALTFCAGMAVGWNRETHGKAAGLRTTILVGLAAAISMIQANILLDTGGKHPDSFAVMDVLRFPLGVLTGVGFIGAGAILRKGDLVTGVTTAATLWVMTAIGLSFGGGQIWLGLAATLIVLVTLLLLKRLDEHLQHRQHGILVLSVPEQSQLPDVAAALERMGYKIRFRGYAEEDGNRLYRFDISWGHARLTQLSALLDEVGRYGLVRKLDVTDASD